MRLKTWRMTNDGLNNLGEFSNWWSWNGALSQSENQQSANQKASLKNQFENHFRIWCSRYYKKSTFYQTDDRITITGPNWNQDFGRGHETSADTYWYVVKTWSNSFRAISGRNFRLIFGRNFLDYDSTGLQKDENCEMRGVENAEIQSSKLADQVTDLSGDDLCLELGKL